MMKKILLLLFTISIIVSCTKDPIINDPTDAEIMDIVGSYEMSYGPHDLAVKDNFVFACRDDKIYVIDIQDVTLPVLVKTIDDLEAGNIFESLYISNNTLFAGCTATSSVYSFNITNPSSPVKISAFSDIIYSDKKFKPYDLFYAGTTLWASGSNGLNGMIVKFSDNGGVLTMTDYWVSSSTGNAGEGIWANAANAFMSTINGFVYSFVVGDIAAGPIGQYTFTNEAGHGHWGRSLAGYGNQLYWADWGAGFITVNISDAANLSADALITHSSFKTQFPDAEGTDVYDVLKHSKNGKIYLANGWSGLVEIDPSSPDQVVQWVDYKENLYYCIEQYENYVILGDNATGKTDVAGLKIIKVAN